MFSNYVLTNMNKVSDENTLVGKGTSKAMFEPKKRGPLGEIGNKPELLQCTATGKANIHAGNLKDVNGKVGTHHNQYSIPTTGTSRGLVGLQSEPQLCKVATKNVKPVAVHTTSTSSNFGQTLKEEEKEVRLTAVSSQTLLPNVEDVDTDDDPIMLSEYVMDIYKYLHQLEIQFPVQSRYLSGSDLSKRTRSLLIDWLSDVQHQFQLMQETLYLSVAIIDRFLQADRSIGRSQLQLVGITSMWVACKYEEMTFPEVDDFVFIADNAYAKSQVVAMEVKILNTLRFNLGYPLPLHFLRRYSTVAACDLHTHILAKYFMELTLLEYEMCHVPSSVVAASAIFIALWLSGGEKRTVWSPSLEYYSEYTLDAILPVATQMAGYIVSAPSSKFQAMRKKFSLHKHLQISKHPLLNSVKLASIANSVSTF